MGTDKILLVDDETELLEIFAEYLDDAGFIVDTANNSTGAISKISNNTYSLLLCDYSMPCGGFVKIVNSALEKNLKLPPTVIISGHAQSDIVESTHISVVKIFAKPVDLNGFSEELKKLIK